MREGRRKTSQDKLGIDQEQVERPGKDALEMPWGGKRASRTDERRGKAQWGGGGMPVVIYCYTYLSQMIKPHAPMGHGPWVPSRTRSRWWWSGGLPGGSVGDGGCRANG